MIALAGLCAGVSPASGLVDAQQPLGPGFGEVRLPSGVVSGLLEFGGRRAWVWRVEEAGGSPTIRVVLDEDVAVTVGPNQFRAARAALWIRPIGLGGVGDAAGVYEVFGYFEDVDTPGGPASYGLTADRLPIEAVIAPREPVRLVTDARFEGPARGLAGIEAFSARADEAFVGALRSIADPGSGSSVDDAAAQAALRPPSWIYDRRVAVGRGDRGSVASVPGEPDAAPVVADRGGAEARGVRSIPFRAGPAIGSRFAGDRLAGEVAPGERVLAVEGDRIARTPPGPWRPFDKSESDRIFTSDGVFFFYSGDRTLESRPDANALTLVGGVVLQYERPGGSVEMVADRAVLFFDPGPLDEMLGGGGVSDVRGIYLEGGVRVTDGAYALRSPRVYYNVRDDRAVLLDAVFRAYEDRIGMPLYMRAAVIRQEASDRFSAEDAVYANTGFAEPHLAIGTTKMTIEAAPGADGIGDRRIVTAQGVTLRGGGVPFFWWPWYKGDPEQFPLRSIGFADSNRAGAEILTGWDPFTLLGIERPEGLDTTLGIDYRSERGMGFGLDSDWSTPTMRGDLLAYVMPDDNGTDLMKNGTEIERGNDTRALLTFRHRWRFRPNWDLQLNAFHASDEGVLPALFEELAEESDEMTTRALLRRVDGNRFLTLEAKGATTDFIPNEAQMQSPGYAVDKLPEVRLGKIGATPLHGRLTQHLVHTWEASASRMRLRFQEITPASLGLTRAGQASRAFGLGPSDSIASRFRDAGLDESFVTRVDTRQEVATKFDLGPVVVNPFLVGRVTGYDSSFESFSPGEDDELRLWGAAGVTLSTSLYRIDNGVESRLFDLHRIRHIIEPTVTFWHAGTTIDREDLPVYDDDVEGLADGSAVRAGLRQTWQTQRGAPGRWRSVDVFTLDVEYAWFGEDVDTGAPIGRYDPARPELSSGGEFIRAAGTWRVSEVVGIGAETVWDVEASREDRSSLGLDIRHSEALRSRFEFRQLESQNDTYAFASLDGLFGDKYEYRVDGTYNFREEDFQRVGLTLLRRFPVGLLGGTLSYNNITGETSFGVQIVPTSADGRRLGGGRLGG